MRYRILGPVEVDDDAGAPLALGAGRARALVAALLLAGGRTVPTGRLVEDLWGEDAPGTAVKMVQILVSGLRKALPPGVLVTRPSGYALEVPGEQVDLACMQALAARGRAALAAGDHAAAADALAAALATWRGPALAGVDAPFAELEARRLEDVRLAVTEDRIEADLALGRHGALVGELEALVARNPLRERLRGQLMLALYGSGRQAEALDAYRQARTALRDELGIDPSPALREVEMRILVQDPALAARPAPPLPAQPPAPAPAAPAPPPGVVGRDGELAALAGHLDRAMAGERRVVLLTGEAGMGKTTLVEAFLATPEAAAVPAALGTCAEQHGSGEAYMPVLTALDGLCRGPAGAELVPVVARRAPTWVVQLPWLVPPEGLAALQQQVMGATRERMLREMLETLREVAAPHGLVLVLEDLHWSDPSTLDLLASLARRREPARLLVVGTMRPAEDGREDPVHLVAKELATRGLVRELSLSPLGEDDVASYLAGRAPGAELPAALARAALARTGGNPLHLEKAVDAWVDAGWLVRADGGWRLAGEVDAMADEVPEGLRELLRRRLARARPGDREILEAASVAAPEFAAALAAAAAGRPEAEVEARCAAMASTGPLLVARGPEAWPDGTVSGRYAFTHDLCHEVLYDDMPPGRRAALHLRAGERLAAAHGDRAGDVAAELANHFLRGGDPARAVGHLRAAAARALERLAPAEAADHLRTALALLDGLPPGDARDGQELALQGLLGAALLLAEGFSSPDAERAMLRTLDLAAVLGLADERAWGLHRLATLYEVRGDYARSEALVAESLARAALRPGGPLLDSHELMACTLFHQGDFGSALEHAERGVELYDGSYVNAMNAATGDNPGVACHAWAALSLWFLGFPDRARDRAAEAVAMAGHPGRRHGLAQALTQAAMVGQWREEPALAMAAAADAMAVGRRHGYAYRVGMATAVHGWALAASGDAGGPDEVRRGLAASRATGARMDDAYMLGLLADACLRAGDPGGALAALDEARAVLPRDGRFFYGAELARLRAACLRAEGDPAGAAWWLRRALEAARRQGARSLALRAATDLAGLLRAGGRADAAHQVLGPALDALPEGRDGADARRAAAVLAGLTLPPVAAP